MIKPVNFVLDVRFFSTNAGNEPVRDWLREVGAADRKTIGEDIKTVQIGWPLGMPLVRKMGKDMWEVRIPTYTGVSPVFCSPSSATR